MTKKKLKKKKTYKGKWLRISHVLDSLCRGRGTEILAALTPSYITTSLPYRVSPGVNITLAFLFSSLRLPIHHNHPDGSHRIRIHITHSQAPKMKNFKNVQYTHIYHRTSPIPYSYRKQTPPCMRMEM